MPRKKAPVSDMDVAGKQATPLAQRLSSLITDPNALKDYLGCSIQAVNQYKLGISRPTLNNLCKIADFYGVSTDFLLGRVPYKTMDIEKQGICEYTGLSENAVDQLHSLANAASGFNFVSGILTSNYLKKILSDMDRLHQTLLLSELETMGGGLKAMYKTIDPDTELTAADYCSFLQYRLSQNFEFAVTDSVTPGDDEIMEKIATLDKEKRDFLYDAIEKKRERLTATAKAGGYKISLGSELPEEASKHGQHHKDG